MIERLKQLIGQEHLQHLLRNKFADFNGTKSNKKMDFKLYKKKKKKLKLMKK